jgi:hypothetical protein
MTGDLGEIVRWFQWEAGCIVEHVHSPGTNIPPILVFLQRDLDIVDLHEGRLSGL